MRGLQRLLHNRPAWTRDPLWARARMVPSFDLDANWGALPIDRVSGLNLTTFTRAASATYVDSDGSVKTAGANVLRRQWDATNRRWGWLAEEARTNLALRSEEFDYWIITGANAAIAPAIDVAAPNGTITAWTLTSSGASAQIQQSVVGTIGTTYTGSFYIRRRSGTGVVNIRVSENVNTPLTGVTSEWQRFSFTATSTSTTIRIGVNLSGTADAVDIWGAQLEVGSFATSYIPATGTAAMRDADLWTCVGSNFSRWYWQDEGSFYSNAASFGLATSSRAVWSATDGTNLNRGELLFNAANNPQYVVASGGSTVAAGGIGGIFATSAVASSASYRLNDFAVVANGSSVTNDASGVLPVSVSRLDIGARLSALPLNGTISRLTYWPRRLDDATLQSLTQ